MMNASTEPFVIDGCHNITVQVCKRFKRLPPGGCGRITMTAPSWLWVGLHQSRNWPWLHNVSTSDSLAKGRITHQRNKSVKHFFDIGANIGQTFDYLSTLEKDFTDYRFWAFEASPRHIPALLAKARLMKSRYNITICAFGVGGQDEVLPFFEKDDVLGDSFEPKTWVTDRHAVENSDTGISLIVPIIGLTGIIKQFTTVGDEILLNIDIEGSEYSMLHSLINDPTAISRVKEMWIEWHGVPNMEDKIRVREQVIKSCSDLGIKLTNRGLAIDDIVE
jgi:FkbM family methyltransferase